jgi:hypothetical protein
MSSVDVIVLGADIEGLVAAAALARAGRAVLLLEESDVVGGIAAGEEFHPGYRSAGVVHEVGCLRRKHLGFLELEQHGLAWDDSDAWTRLPVLQGADVEAFGRWREFVDRVRPWVNELVDSPAPEAAQPAAVDLLGLAKTGFSLRRLGERDMFELLRIASLPLADWMGECFEDQALRVALAAPALLGTALGPRAPGTAGLRWPTPSPPPAGVWASTCARVSASRASASKPDRCAGSSSKGSRSQRRVYSRRGVRGARCWSWSSRDTCPPAWSKSLATGARAGAWPPSAGPCRSLRSSPSAGAPRSR